MSILDENSPGAKAIIEALEKMNGENGILAGAYMSSQREFLNTLKQALSIDPNAVSGVSLEEIEEALAALAEAETALTLTQFGGTSMYTFSPSGLKVAESFSLGMEMKTSRRIGSTVEGAE